MKYVQLGKEFLAYPYSDNRPAADLLVQGITQLLTRELILIVNPPADKASPIISMTYRSGMPSSDTDSFPVGYVTSVFTDHALITVQLSPFTTGELVGLVNYFDDLEIMFAGSPDNPQYYLRLECKPETIPLIKAVLPELVSPSSKKNRCQFATIPPVTCKLTPYMFARIESNRPVSRDNILKLAEKLRITKDGTPEEVAQECLYKISKDSAIRILNTYKACIEQESNNQIPRNLQKILDALNQIDFDDDDEYEDTTDNFGD